MPDIFLEKLKESLERQIITVLDFLFADNQITEDQVIDVSQNVLNGLDSSQTKHEIYGYFYKLTRTYSILEPYLKNTLKGLNQYSHGS